MATPDNTLAQRALDACEWLARDLELNYPGDTAYRCWLVGREIIEQKRREAEKWRTNGNSIEKRNGLTWDHWAVFRSPEQAAAVCRALNKTEPK